MDEGFGKLDRINLLVKKNFKLVTIAATLGSQHPFIPSSLISQNCDKLKQISA
jgi:hypothetical protein